MATLVERMKQTGAPVYHAEAARALEVARAAIVELRDALANWVEIADDCDEREEDQEALAMAGAALTLLDAQA